jgi:hypothetical protein
MQTYTTIMNDTLHQQIIENYVRAYNGFDIEGMLAGMHKDVRFENISNGEVTLVTNGIAELKKQAKQAGEYFKEREQKITGMQHKNNLVEADIDYKATLAVDLPNGMKAGDTIEMKGKSVFRFRGDKIIELKDIS